MAARRSWLRCRLVQRSLARQEDTSLHPGREETEDAGPIPLLGHCFAMPCRARDKRRYKLRNRIEIMFGRLKDWRRVATRYDRCPQIFFSAVVLAATVTFWL
ncbi:transposase, IS4 family protein [Citreicella sp. 357]|nr:transposase, IS4 family protein [Citreicella sp. 357]